MSNKPNTIAGGVIEFTEQGLKQMERERLMKAQAYLDEAGKNQTIEIAVLNQVVNSAIQHHGLPSVEDAETFLARAKALAHSLAHYQLQQKYLGIKDTLAHLKIKDTVPLLEWAAKQHGVDLFGDSKH